MEQRRGGRALTRILQVVHGFPPRENAGTETYAARLAAGLRSRGHVVHTLAATLDPARPMYTVYEDGEGVTRVVNNLPGREGRRAGGDEAIDRVFAAVRERFRPDIVHVQHLMGLSTTLPRGGLPTVWTLHDAWGWCGAGGTLLPPLATAPCSGPNARCAQCMSAWQHDSGRVDAALAVASRAGRLVDPAVLHRMWKRVPARVRARLVGGAPEPLSSTQVDARRAAFAAFARSCTVVAPSRFLARTAEANGFGSVAVVPHGIDREAGSEPPSGRGRVADGPLVFIGTLARHKGPDLVRAAWQRSGVQAALRVYGPPGPDPTFQVENDGALSPLEVTAALRSARALVLGSIWPENAPLIVLEARAVGCPVIAPAIGGIPEIVEDGVDGWLYPPGDVDALAAALRRPLPSTPRPPPSFDAHLDAILGVYGASG